MADFQWSATAGTYKDFVAAASFASLANNSMAVGTAIANTSAPVPMLLEVSFISTVALTVTAGGHLAIGLLPLLHNGSGYPTNDTTGTALPGIGYVRGVITFPAGSITPQGSTLVVVPFGTWKPFVINRLGAAFSSSTTAHVCQYRTVFETVA